MNNYKSFTYKALKTAGWVSYSSLCGILGYCSFGYIGLSIGLIGATLISLGMSKLLRLIALEIN